VQVSATSQTPAEARHVIPFGTSTSVGHAALAPVQVSGTSHVGPEATGLQTVVKNRGWHVAEAPSQVSDLSHGPLTVASQTTPSAIRVSEGHAASVPVHASAVSHAPAEGRQTRPEFPGLSEAQTGTPVVQLTMPT